LLAQNPFRASEYSPGFRTLAAGTSAVAKAVQSDTFFGDVQHGLDSARRCEIP
jgi:hypothetical protein